MNTSDLRNRFTHHPPKGDQQARYEQLREAGLQLAMQILAFTPPSPEQTEAIDLLDLAINKANAAIARNEAWTMGEAWQLVNASPGAAAYAGEGEALREGPSPGKAVDAEYDLRRQAAERQADQGPRLKMNQVQRGDVNATWPASSNRPPGYISTRYN
jgi:hypothetical protein